MIPIQIIELLKTGVSVVVGTRDASLMPECTRAWGIRASKDATSVIVFLTESTSRKTIENLRDNGQIAISCARPTDHVACQLKGRVHTIRRSKAADRDSQEHWRRDFFGELAAVGVPTPVLDALITEPALAVEIHVTEVFHQTPGPGAGERL